MNRFFVVLFVFCSNVLFGQQVIKNLQWLNVDQEIDELTAGYGLTLYAETENIDDNEIVKITIWGKGDINDDLVGEYITRVYNNKIMFHWNLIFEQEKMQSNFYEIQEKGFTKPQYYFIVQYNKRKSENSKLLNVLAWIRTQMAFAHGPVIKNHKYKLLLPDKSEVIGWTDAEGYIRQENLSAYGKVYYYFMESDEEPEVLSAYTEPEKPVYYVIKENDSLWKIASYDFIYGDPYLWTNIYEHNRYNFIEENNPNLIETGQTLLIVPLLDETRYGTR